MADSREIGRLRPFDLQRDLLAVADLVELCFRDNLDEDGRLYIRQMRRAAGNQRLLRMAAAGGDELPLGGFVWSAGEDIIGNLSLISIRVEKQRRFLIANVAVHPDHRRQGIATSLTEAALAEARTRGTDEIWLQADEENEAAQQLYRNMGFEEMARRTTWETTPAKASSASASAQTEVRRLRGDERADLQRWMKISYPSHVRWNLPLDLGQMQPGISGTFKRLFSDRASEQWGAYEGEQLRAAMVWQSSSLNADRLWLCGPTENQDAIGSLLGHVHDHLARQRSLRLNYPAGVLEDLLRVHGFAARRTLVWMRFGS